MPRLTLVLLSLSLGAVCAIVLAACGSDDEDGTIPPQNAAAMLTALDDARAEQEQGDCEGVADATGNLLTAVNEAPNSVDPEVRQAIVQGANNLQTLAQDETKCQPTGPTGEEGPETTDTTTSTPPPTTTETTTDTTTEEETKPPKPKPPKPKPQPQPEQPGNEGGGLGQGNSGGTPPSDDTEGPG